MFSPPIGSSAPGARTWFVPSAQLQVFEQQQEMVKKHGTNINLNQLEKFDDKLEMFDLLQKLQKIDFIEVFICFFLYFIGGYLFYSAIMAAISRRLPDKWCTP